MELEELELDRETSYDLPSSLKIYPIVIDYPNINDEQQIVRANINNSFGDIKPWKN